MNTEIVTQLAAVPVASLAVYLFYRLLSNHMRHMSDVIEAMVGVIAENTQVSERLTEWLKGRFSKEN